MLRAILTAGLAFLLSACAAPEKRVPTWSPEGDHVWRSPSTPAAYALVDGEAALLFGAPADADLSELQWAGITVFDAVMVTHAHLDGLDSAPAWAAAGIPIRAPKACEPLISPDGVRRFWSRALPEERSAGMTDRTFPDGEFRVLPEGIDGVRFDVEDGQAFDWRGWTITPLATPGHTRSHFAYLARRKGDEGSKPLVFCGDALAAPGVLWAPFSTDWDSGGDLGLRAAASSLRKLAVLEPAGLFPEHGPAILGDAAGALLKTAERADEAAFLKSYARYTKERVGNPPPLKLLAKDQLTNDGRKPFTRISEHLFQGGNTFVVSSLAGGLWMSDPHGELLAGQLLRLQLQKLVGDIDLVTVTTAQHDHVTGIQEIPGRSRPPVWTLDLVASALSDPGYNRAADVHPVPVEIAKALEDGEASMWKEYALRFHALGARGRFGSAIETVIDQKHCLFAGDAFLPPDVGGAGWSGFNRALPSQVVDAVKLLLKIKPDWVLVSRGASHEFNEADARRRLAWAQAAVAAADALSPSGDHRLNWDPQRVAVEPFRTRSSPGREVGVELLVRNPSPQPVSLRVRIEGRGVATDIDRKLEVPADGSSRVPVALKIADRVPPGRYPLAVRVFEGPVERDDDAVLLLDVR